MAGMKLVRVLRTAPLFHHWRRLQSTSSLLQQGTTIVRSYDQNIGAAHTDSPSSDQHFVSGQGQAFSAGAKFYNSTRLKINPYIRCIFPLEVP
jgi:hypothetical protein